MTVRVGLISDTHNLLRPAALEFLRGSDHIIHAGDVCRPEVLEALRAIAPLTAVRGNNDQGDWAQALAQQELLDIGGVRVLVIHDLADLRELPPGIRVVASGHSHKPEVQERGGVVYVNPGSAGPRRFRLPISVGELRIEHGHVSARTVTLSP
jgi:putative phosphoesterase